jgi:hypothetical protein
MQVPCKLYLTGLLSKGIQNQFDFAYLVNKNDDESTQVPTNENDQQYARLLPLLLFSYPEELFMISRGRGGLLSRLLTPLRFETYQRFDPARQDTRQDVSEPRSRRDLN